MSDKEMINKECISDDCEFVTWNESGICTLCENK